MLPRTSHAVGTSEPPIRCSSPPRSIPDRTERPADRVEPPHPGLPVPPMPCGLAGPPAVMGASPSRPWPKAGPVTDTAGAIVALLATTHRVSPVLVLGAIAPKGSGRLPRHLIR